MTQTTAGRITEIIREHLKFYAGSGEWAAAVEAGQEIAAEIDTKDKRIAELESLLREAATMIKNADVSVSTLTKAGNMLAAGLDKAYAEIEALNSRHAQHTAVSTTEWKVEMAAVRQERDEARAEVERLRPAAEAWEAQENSASIFMRYLRGHAPYEDTITAEGNAKAARARAAKGTP